MSTKGQQQYEMFRVLLSENTGKEEKKLAQLSVIKSLLNDKDLNNHLAKRENFLKYCRGSLDNLAKVTAYKGNEQLIDTCQKEFYLSSDKLKKEALTLMAGNQKLWFEKLFKDNFDTLKTLLRSLLIFENQNDLATIERVIQEIELLRFKSGF